MDTQRGWQWCRTAGSFWLSTIAILEHKDDSLASDTTKTTSFNSFALFRFHFSLLQHLHSPLDSLGNDDTNNAFLVLVFPELIVCRIEFDAF